MIKNLADQAAQEYKMSLANACRILENHRSRMLPQLEQILAEKTGAAFKEMTEFQHGAIVGAASIILLLSEAKVEDEKTYDAEGKLKEEKHSLQPPPYEAFTTESYKPKAAAEESVHIIITAVDGTGQAIDRCSGLQSLF